MSAAAERRRSRQGRLRRAMEANRPPPEVVAVLRGARGEQLIAWGRDPAGEPLVATTQGLWGYGERLAWDEIDHVSWSEGELTIRAVDDEERVVALREERDLPAVVKAQVEASVLHSQAVPLLPDGRGVTLTARRHGPAGPVSWRMRFDRGLSADDPVLRAHAEQELSRVRGELGV